ncbi:hypothetical protein [Streptomyces sp. NPDC058735]|uniref:hypothetical protein n=1 Tax=unclassified Streptomyces TaxID=2593676 RepID=UPI003678E01B
MGEHQSDGGHPGRRHVHLGNSAGGHRAPGGAGGRPSGDPATARLGHPGHPGASSVLDDAELHALLAGALLRQPIDADAEQRAVAAFRAVRDAGALQARSRRRDDWRPRKRLHPGRSLKATLSVLLASLTLGGVAVAAIGSSDSPDDSGERGRPPASSPAHGRSQVRPPDAPRGSASPERPAPAQDTEAHCRAYEEAGGRGRSMDATAWQRLVDAAGGERNITAYCTGQSEPDDAKPGDTTPPGKKSATPGAGRAGNGAGQGENGSGAAGNGRDSAGNGGSGGSGASGGGGESRTEGRPGRPNSGRP